MPDVLPTTGGSCDSVLLRESPRLTHRPVTLYPSGLQERDRSLRCRVVGEPLVAFRAEGRNPDARLQYP